MEFNLYDFFSSTREKGIIFCFCGPVSQGVIEGIGQTLRQKMSIEEQSQNTIQKVFSVFIEQMQNIVNYSTDKLVGIEVEEGDIRLGILVIGHAEDAISVTCGNMICAEDVSRLADSLSRIRDMGPEELKALYKERRRQAPTTSSKGAGLGFIDMARKASRPLDFDFQLIDNHTAFFSIRVVI